MSDRKTERIGELEHAKKKLENDLSYMKEKKVQFETECQELSDHLVRRNARINDLE